MNLPKFDPRQIDLSGVDMKQVQAGTNKATGWIHRTIESLCNRPDHLQRLAVIGSGMVLYPMILGVIWIVWKGYDPTPINQTQSLGIMGIALYSLMALFGLTIIALLGIVKGLRIDGPGGFGVELETTADDPDREPGTTQVTTRFGDHHGRETVVQTTTAVTPPAAPAPAPADPPTGKAPPEVSE